MQYTLLLNFFELMGRGSNTSLTDVVFMVKPPVRGLDGERPNHVLAVTIRVSLLFRLFGHGIHEILVLQDCNDSLIDSPVNRSV